MAKLQQKIEITQPNYTNVQQITAAQNLENLLQSLKQDGIVKIIGKVIRVKSTGLDNPNAVQLGNVDLGDYRIRIKFLENSKNKGIFSDWLRKTKAKFDLDLEYISQLFIPGDEKLISRIRTIRLYDPYYYVRNNSQLMDPSFVSNENEVKKFIDYYGHKIERLAVDRYSELKSFNKVSFSNLRRLQVKNSGAEYNLEEYELQFFKTLEDPSNFPSLESLSVNIFTKAAFDIYLKLPIGAKLTSLSVNVQPPEITDINDFKALNNINQLYNKLKNEIGLLNQSQKSNINLMNTGAKISEIEIFAHSALMQTTRRLKSKDYTKLFATISTTFPNLKYLELKFNPVLFEYKIIKESILNLKQLKFLKLIIVNNDKPEQELNLLYDLIDKSSLEEIILPNCIVSSVDQLNELATLIEHNKSLRKVGFRFDETKEWSSADLTKIVSVCGAKTIQIIPYNRNEEIYQKIDKIIETKLDFLKFCHQL